MHIPYGTEVENISLDHLGYEKNFAGTDGMPEGGMSRLINELAKEIQSNGGQIQLGRAVEKITSLGQGKGVQVEIKGSEESKQGEETTIQAKTAIVTIPLAVLQQSKTKGLFEPPLDSSVRNTIQKVTVGNLNKVLLTYKQPWWSLDAGTFVILPASKASEPTVGGDNGRFVSVDGHLRVNDTDSQLAMRFQYWSSLFIHLPFTTRNDRRCFRQEARKLLTTTKCRSSRQVPLDSTFFSSKKRKAAPAHFLLSMGKAGIHRRCYNDASDCRQSSF